MKQFIKSVLIVGAAILGLGAVLGFADAHAIDLSKIKVKTAKVKTYTVKGKEVNPAQALVDALNGEPVSECKPVELEIGTNGMPHFKTK